MTIPSTCKIYYFPSSTAHNQYIECPITRWDEDNWGLVCETFLGSGNRNILFANVTPGAVKELYNILGVPHFKDITYSSGNTLIIEPIYGYGISSLREKRVVAVRNISDRFITPDYFNIKIEAVRLDT